MANLKMKMRNERSNEIGLSVKRILAQRANPRPGTKISEPAFGYELFVAHLYPLTTFMTVTNKSYSPAKTA